jgi:hypothetical protein
MAHEGAEKTLGQSKGSGRTNVDIHRSRRLGGSQKATRNINSQKIPPTNKAATTSLEKQIHPQQCIFCNLSSESLKACSRCRYVKKLASGMEYGYYLVRYAIYRKCRAHSNQSPIGVFVNISLLYKIEQIMDS